MGYHPSPVFRPAFPSSAIISERSSPSSVRFAAPNNGAPLTSPGRSDNATMKWERLPPKGPGNQSPLSPPFWSLFARHRHDGGHFPPLCRLNEAARAAGRYAYRLV
jgi:hypothetical protein